MDKTKGLILATVAITGSVTLVEQFSGKRPVSFRSYLGDSMMGIFLTIVAMIDERLARNFCVLIILAVLIKDGGKVFAFAGSAGNAQPVTLTGKTDNHGNPMNTAGGVGTVPYGPYAP